MEDNNKYLYDALTEKLGGKLEGDILNLPGGFGIKARFDVVKEGKGSKLFTAVFMVYHDDFDEPVLEPVDVEGKNIKEAAVRAVEMFHAVLWRTIDQAVTGSDPVPVSVELSGEHYDFDMYCRAMVRIGVENKQPESLLKKIMNEIPGYLGSKKYYWLRIYLAKYKDEKVIEVRLNGSVCADLAGYFEEYVTREMDGSDHFVCEKQYAIFVQREDDKCPFDKKLVMDITAETIKRMAETEDEEDREGMVAKSNMMAGKNRGLAAEIRAFIPEIVARLTLGTREGDSLFLQGPDGKEYTEFRKSQVRSYFYVMQAVLLYFKTRPDKAGIEKIVMGSASYRAYCKAMIKAKDEGRDIKAQDLYVKGIPYRVDTQDYRVW